MNQETLDGLREKFREKKEEIKEHNKKVLRIRELMNNEAVKEYIELVGQDDNMRYININNVEIIDKIYRPFLSEIKDRDRNNIYFYLGTYSFFYHYDITDGGVDKKVNYDDKLADYRLYWNIEGSVPVRIPVDQSLEFEKNNVVIGTYFGSAKDYYFIQKEFFANAVVFNQNKAKKMLIKKYGRFGK